MVSLLLVSMSFEMHPVAAESLESQLELIASQRGIVLSGQENTADEKALWLRGKQAPPISDLLVNFNYIVSKSPEGRTTRITILGRKRATPPPPKRIELTTRRQGSHHLIDAVLHGTNNQQIETELLIDTGSTFVVLPRSLLSELGFASDQLYIRDMQTANGKVSALIGALPALRIASFQVEDVAVAFVDDDDLGGRALLGMSVLGRFRVTLNDTENRLILSVGN